MQRNTSWSGQKDVADGTVWDSGSGSNSQSDVGENNHKNGSLFSLSSLFWGFNQKGSSESVSLRSPTSHLDHRLFSCFGNPFKSPRSLRDGFQKAWNSSKVGLSVIDSLDDDAGDECGGDTKTRLCDSKNVLLGPKARVKHPTENCSFPCTHVKSPLRNGCSGVIFEIASSPQGPELNLSGTIQSFSMDSCSLIDCQPQAGKGSEKTRLSCSSWAENGYFQSIPTSGIELSEDYTRVTSHGPNPKITHIYGDCILDCQSGLLDDFVEKFEEEMKSSSKNPALYPSIDFLSFCHACKKFLEEGKDIYMYRGEKAFCSVECRLKEILFIEEIEKTSGVSSEN